MSEGAYMEQQQEEVPQQEDISITADIPDHSSPEEEPAPRETNLAQAAANAESDHSSVEENDMAVQESA